MSMLAETPGAGPSNSPSTETNSHLSYYTHEKSASPPPESIAPPTREISKNRLYVGNLHPTVDEFTLVQVFNKFGKISKLDFLFHKSGPSKGKPRGYAFVEYADKEDALKALVNAHDKLLRGRKLVVTYANQAPTNEFIGSYGTGSGKHRRVDVQRPTALSLIKSTTHPGKTEDKIAAMEAKLRQMQKQNSTSLSTLPSHPSLPLKPPPSTVQTNSTSEPQKHSPSRTPASTATHSTSSGRATKTNSEVRGIFASGSSAPLGKKPTLEELMKAKKKATTQGGLLKR